MTDRRLPEDEGGSVGAPHDLPFLPVALLTDLAEQFLEDVLQRHDPGGLSILVHDDCDVNLPPLELAQQRMEFLHLGDDVGRTHEILPHRRLSPLGHRAEQLLEMEDTDDVVPLALVDGNPGPAVTAIPGDQLLVGQIPRDHEDVGQRSHDLPGAPIGHFEDVVDELRLLRVEGAGLLSGVDQRAELGLGDHLAGLRSAPLPQQEEDPAGDLLEHESRGSDHAGERMERSGGHQGEAAGPRPHEALRRHVPDQQDPQRTKEKGDTLADPGGKMRKEQGGDDRRDRHVDDLVSQEYRRDQAVRLREHLRDPLCPVVPLLLPLQKIHPAQGEQRRLRRGKERGGEEQEGEKDRFHDGVSGCGASGAGSGRIRMEARRPRATRHPCAARGSPRPSSPRR